LVGAQLLASLAEFKFNLKAMGKLYLARTKDDKLLINKKN
jgi:hypothetical protein